VLQEVNIEGKTYIFDNNNPGGVLKENYVRTLEVFDKSGKVYTGDAAYNVFVKSTPKK
jgi:hypothetical protein